MTVDFRAVLFWLMTCAAVAGCGTTSGRLPPEVPSGNPLALAEYHLERLEENPDDRRARNGLFSAGNEAVALLLAEAAAAAEAADFAAETDAFFSIDGLRGRAAAAGVSLQVPTDYPQRRRAAFDRMIAELISSAGTAAEARRWQDALRAYERIATALEPDEDTAAFVLAAQAALFLEWAEEELEAEQYRAAHQLVLQAADHAPDTASAERAELLRLLVEDQGKKRVAVVPVHFLDARHGEAEPFPALAETVMALADERSELFVEPVAAGAVWRETRRLRRSAESLAGENLLEVGAALDADVIAILRPGEADSRTLEMHLFDVATASIMDVGVLHLDAAGAIHWQGRPTDESQPPARPVPPSTENLAPIAELILDGLFGRIAVTIQ